MISENTYSAGTNKRLLWAMTAVQAGENHGDEAWPNTFDDEHINIYGLLPIWSHSQYSVAAVGTTKQQDQRYPPIYISLIWSP